MTIRNKFISLMYLVFLVFFVLQKIYVEENLYKIEEYDKVVEKLEFLTAEHECLSKKFEIADEYAGKWFDIDWDKALELKELGNDY